MKTIVRAAFGCATFALAGVGLFAAPAGAQAGQCTATMNGTDVASFATPDTALTVTKDASLDVLGRHATTPQAFGYSIKLELGGVQWSIGSGATNGTEYRKTVNVADYATRGAGIYKVLAASSGGGIECFERAYVKVDGDGPLSTTAGQVAAVAGVIGLAATVTAAARARPITPSAVEEGVGK